MAESPATPTPTPIPMPAPVEVPLLSDDRDSDELVLLTAVVCGEVDAVASDSSPWTVVAVATAADTEVAVEVKVEVEPLVELVVVDVVTDDTVEELGGSSLLILK